MCASFLDRVDDRYVIMNAGDELKLVSAPAPPGTGSTGISCSSVTAGRRTATTTRRFPRPSSRCRVTSADYESAPNGQLEDDPMYRRHPADWQNHTSIRDTDGFLRGVR
jgi:hypothetical protein